MDNFIKEYKYTDFTSNFDEGYEGYMEDPGDYEYTDISIDNEGTVVSDEAYMSEDSADAVRTKNDAVQDRYEAELMIKEAESQAAMIIKEAMDTAERVKKDAFVEAGAAASEAQKTGYKEGFEIGHREGYAEGVEEARTKLDEQNRSLLEEISRAIAELDKQKTDYIRMYNEEMKELVIAIAEKVINVSLKSSGEIIRRMILNAVENRHEKLWAKVFISEHDANIMVHEDSDILDALRNVSDNIKIEVMENGEQGDLLVEYPDQVIDAGVKTQLNNIRQIMNEVG